MSGQYDDIIHLSRPVSASYRRMAIANRAAQFTPFAALTGYDAAIHETARLTDERIELDESAIDAINAKLRVLADHITNHPEVSIIYYEPDEKKAGGAYITVTNALKKIDDVEHTVVLVGGMKIKMEDILDIECELLDTLYCEVE